MSGVTIIQVDPSSPWGEPPLPCSMSECWPEDSEVTQRPKFVSVLLVNGQNESEIISEGDKSIIQLHAVGSTVAVLPEASDPADSRHLHDLTLVDIARSGKDVSASLVTIADTQWTTISTETDAMTERVNRIRQVPPGDDTPTLTVSNEAQDRTVRSSQLIQCQVMEESLMEYSGSWNELSTSMAQKHVNEKRQYVEILNGTNSVIISEVPKGLQHNLVPTEDKPLSLFTDQGITLNVTPIHNGSTLRINGTEMFP